MNRTRVGILLAGVGLVIIVGTVVVSVNVGKADRDQRYLEAVRSAPATQFGDVPDEQLLSTLDSRCEKIADGQTLADEMAAAERNWSAVVSDITQAEYYANVRALYLAAESVC